MINKLTIIMKGNYTKYTNYIILSILVIFLILFTNSPQSQRKDIRKLIKNPNILIILIASIGVLSFYNIYLSMASMGMLIIIMMTKDDVNNTISKFEVENDSDLNEGFSGKKDRNHTLLKNFGIDMEEMTNDLMDGLSENKRMKIKKRNQKIEKLNNKKREGFNNTGTINIPKRKFNPDKEVDINLMETRKILEDLINRIDYKYEEIDYLKKYIGSRIEEIVELNGLLEDDE